MNYAGFWTRFLALLIDAVILIIPTYFLNSIIPFAGAVLMNLLYKPVFESSSLQATPGKALMGIAVVSETGATLTFKQAFIRYLLSYVSGAILGIGYFMNLFTAKRQTLHDMISEAVVIHKEVKDGNYFTIWLNQIKKIGGDTTIDSSPTSNSSTAAPVTSGNAHETAKMIEELHKLLQNGAITQQEYETKKNELLNKI